MFVSRQSRHFSFVDNWRVGNYVPCQGKGINKRMKIFLLLQKFVAFWYCTVFEMIHCLLSLELFSLIIEEIDILMQNLKKPIQSPQLTELFLQNHGNMEKKRKIIGGFVRNTKKYKEQLVTKHT